MGDQLLEVVAHDPLGEGPHEAGVLELQAEALVQRARPDARRLEPWMTPSMRSASSIV
jgi:hypothetical protein